MLKKESANKKAKSIFKKELNNKFSKKKNDKPKKQSKSYYSS